MKKILPVFGLLAALNTSAATINFPSNSTTQTSCTNLFLLVSNKQVSWLTTNTHYRRLDWSHAVAPTGGVSLGVTGTTWTNWLTNATFRASLYDYSSPSGNGWSIWMEAYGDSTVSNYYRKVMSIGPAKTYDYDWQKVFGP